MLTTFNEVDMTAVMAMRERTKQAFKASRRRASASRRFSSRRRLARCQDFPLLNAEIQGDEMVLQTLCRHWRGGRRTARARRARAARRERMSFAQIEKQISATSPAARRRDAVATISTAARSQSPTAASSDRCSAHPFSIRRRCGILGLHKIEDRPIAVTTGESSCGR